MGRTPEPDLPLFPKPAGEDLCPSCELPYDGEVDHTPAACKDWSEWRAGHRRRAMEVLTTGCGPADIARNGLTPGTSLA